MLTENKNRANRTRSLSLSEVMTILVLFHGFGYHNLKQFYLEFVSQQRHSEFPDLVSYRRFVEFEEEALIRLYCLFGAPKREFYGDLLY